jgi:tetratricopeptide (TPR) repeat protein
LFINKSAWISYTVRALIFVITCMLTVTSSEAGQSQSLIAAELQRHSNLAEAETALQRELEQARKIAGPRSLDFSEALARLGVFYQDTGRFSQAESAFIASLNILEETTSHKDPAWMPSMIHLAWLYVETGRAAPAGRLHLESAVTQLTLFEPDSTYLPPLLELLGGLYALQGKLTNAEEAYHKDIELLTRRGAGASVDMASALNNLGFFELKARRYKEALDVFPKALELWVKLSGPGELQAATSRLGLAEAYMGLGRYNASGELIEQVLPIFEQRCGPNSLRTAQVLMRYSQVLRYQKRKDEAKRVEARVRVIHSASAKDLSFEQVVDVRDLRKSGTALVDRPVRP